MIESARFTNNNGLFVDLNDDDVPFRRFTTEVTMRMTEREKSQQHGIYPSNTYMGKRLFHCEGDLFADTSGSYITKRLALVGALMPRPHHGFKHSGVLEMLFTGMTETLRTECTLDGYPDLPMEAGLSSRSSFLINLKSFDPRLYGASQVVNVNFLQAENFGGLDFDFTFPFDFVGGIESVNDVAIVNSGNIETYPVVVFHGQCVDPQLILTRSDGTTHFFRMLGLTIPSGYTATVDFLRRTAVMSDGVNLYNYAVDSDWWAIEPIPATNIVRFAVASAIAPAKAVVTWRNAYMI